MRESKTAEPSPWHEEARMGAGGGAALSEPRTIAFVLVAFAKNNL